LTILCKISFLSGFNIRIDNLFSVSFMSSPSSSDLAVIESKLKGKTLLVYWHLLKSPTSKVGVRQIQRSLRFSSPSVAAHHLDKLLSLGLVDKSKTGEYFLVQEVKVGLLRFFTKLGRFLVPRYLFYSVWLSTMLAFYLIFYGFSWPTCVHNIAAIILGALASFILWFETIRLWREKPF
jgi:DNA-binding transcriptional ArsR family regulator